MNPYYIIPGVLVLLFLFCIVVEPWTPEGKFATIVVGFVVAFIALFFGGVFLILKGFGL